MKNKTGIGIMSPYLSNLSMSPYLSCPPYLSGTVPASKGIVGVATEAGVNAVTHPGAVLSIAGTATELGEEGLAVLWGWRSSE
jgi:hypothetical protein